MAILRITSRPAYGQIVECERELVIGRADADVVVDDAEISGRHAVVRPLPDGIEVEDLGSLNGTFVDDERITGPTKLTPGSTLKLGVTTFALEAGPPPPMRPRCPRGTRPPCATRRRPGSATRRRARCRRVDRRAVDRRAVDHRGRCRRRSAC